MKKYETIYIENGKLIIPYKEYSYKTKIDEQKKRNYMDVGIGLYEAEKLSTYISDEINYTEKSLIEIPFKSITDTYYDKSKNYNGECDFSISTKNNEMINRNITKGTTNYSSYFKFTYDCSKEEDLGNRINKALQHIISLIPKDSRIHNEPF